MKISKLSFRQCVTALVCLLFTPFATASFDYWLNAEQSSLHFLSTKNNSVTETHRFATLSGRIQAAENRAQLAISLASAETGIAIRDQRLAKQLFEVGDFPVALVSTELDYRFIESLQTGETKQRETVAQLQLHGQQQTLTTTLRVTKLADSALLVSTIKPILISAADFSLVSGINKLREIAGLQSINTTVPVTFQLLFEIDTVSR